MQNILSEFKPRYDQATKDLFRKRTFIFLWLGIIFFPLFSLLDYVVSKENWLLFLFYRFCISFLLIAFVVILHRKTSHAVSKFVLFSAYICGGFCITMMALKMGGYTSSYYVGIMLIVVAGFAFLPLTVTQASVAGLCMYATYTIPIFFLYEHTGDSLTFFINNSFFFLGIIIVSLVQCHEDIKARRRKCRLTIHLESLNKDLTFYTHNLEDEVEKRVTEIAESELRYKELYNNILDQIVLINDKAAILLANQHFCDIIGQTQRDVRSTSFLDIVHPDCLAEVKNIMLPQLFQGNIIKDFQLTIRGVAGKKIDVECNARNISKHGKSLGFQFVIRDISERKKLEKTLVESYTLIDKSRTTAILALAKLSEFRDKDTGNHLERMREYSQILAKKLATKPEYKNYISTHYIDDIYLSSILHDIGKVGIPDDVLLKPGKLTYDEFEIMKRHAVYGGDAIQKSEKLTNGGQSFLSLGKAIAYHHHEKWDGSGYPYGLKGGDIPLSARIVALADVYDALTSKRCYKSAFSHEKAKEIIVQGSGRHFDPEVVDAFLSTEKTFQETRIKILIH